MNEHYIRQNPYVDDDGIYVPVNEYVPEGCGSAYRCIITKELFIEAYNKWIKNNKNNPYIGCNEDDADCWCDD